MHNLGLYLYQYMRESFAPFTNEIREFREIQHPKIYFAHRQSNFVRKTV